MGKWEQEQGGRFLTEADRRAVQRQRQYRQVRRIRRWMTVTVLLLWDGLLLYMIVRCLIEPVWGGAFVAVVSIYLGYRMK